MPTCGYTPACTVLFNKLSTYCTSEASVSKLRSLDGQFNSGQFAGDPWTHVDSFGCSAFQKGLITAFKNLKPTPVKAVTIPSQCSSVSSTVSRNVLHGSGNAQKLAFFGNISSSEISKALEELKEGSSKN